MSARMSGGGLGTCPDCGKMRHRSRSEAKQAARRQHPGQHLSQFRCGEFWHNGHVHPLRLAGNGTVAASHRTGDEA